MGFVFCLPIDLVFLSSVASCFQSESLDQSAWRYVITPLPLAPTPSRANACSVRPAAIPIGGGVVPARSRMR